MTEGKRGEGYMEREGQRRKGKEGWNMRMPVLNEFCPECSPCAGSAGELLVREEEQKQQGT